MQNIGHRHAVVFAAPLIFVQRQLLFSNKRLHFQLLAVVKSPNLPSH